MYQLYRPRHGGPVEGGPLRPGLKARERVSSGRQLEQSHSITLNLLFFSPVIPFLATELYRYFL
jgi:hypothetical protein